MTDEASPGEAFLGGVVARARVVGPWRALAAAARSLATARGSTLDERSLRLFTDEPDDSVAALPDPPPPDDPALLGDCLEALLTADQRVAGAHHTPLPVAAQVVGLAVGGATPAAVPGADNEVLTEFVPGPGADEPPSVCDPAVGGGVFLLAAAERLHDRGLSRPEAVGCLWGFDTDPLAVAVTEASLALWAGVTPPGAEERLLVGDFLDRSVARVRPPGGWSVIVGNPPFQSQLAGRTARDRARAEDHQRRFGPVARGYVDEAGLFVLAGSEHLADGGRMALILPASLLAASGAAPLRRIVSARAPLRIAWVPSGPWFAASVDVVVAVFERGQGGDRSPHGPRSPEVTVLGGSTGPPPGTARGERSGAAEVVAGRGRAWDQPLVVPDPGSTWSALLADAEGVPRVDLEPDPERGGDRHPGRLGDRAEVTAGFRQQFYGLAAAVRDGPAGHDRPLITVGLIDPLTSHWGRRPTRLAGNRYASPVVDPAAIVDPEVVRWVEARHRPKVLVATQTRVVEAVVDRRAGAVPSTPVISVEPDDPEADLWYLAAVLCVPPVTAWFHRRGAGGGLSGGRIRPTAALVRAVPLPADSGAWATGAELARLASTAADVTGRRAILTELGAVMTGAYGCGPEVTTWWSALLPLP